MADLPPLAHPLTEAGGLPVPPIVVATIAVLVVATVARLGSVRVAGEHGSAPAARPGATAAAGGHAGRAGRGEPTAAAWATRLLATVALVGAAVAGQIGSQRELDNLAPALLVGFTWPMLLVASAALGRIWPWLDPFDTLARILAPDGEEPGDPAVTWAVPAAFAWVWYLGAYPGTLAPRAVAAAVIAYTTAVLAGCLVAGRRPWLARAELFGLVYGWVGLRVGGLVPWRPPRDADLVLGVLAGGLLFGAVRLSRLWGSLNVVPGAAGYALAGCLLCAAAGAVLLRRAERAAARLGAAGSVAATAVPAVAALAVALSLARDRLLVSAQLLPALVSDPLGRGWDLFGTADLPLVAEPLGVAGRVALQLAVLIAGAAAGILVARRRTTATNPAVTAAAVLVAAGSLAVTAV